MNKNWTFVALIALVGCGRVEDTGDVGTASLDETREQQAIPAVIGRCASCHGVKGISRISSYPNLAGKDELYISEQLMLYREGTRVHPIMNSVAINLSDDDIKMASRYYASFAFPP